MENLGGFLGIAVALALGAYYRNKWTNATRAARFRQVITVLIAAGAAGALGSIGGQWLRYYASTSTSSEVDKPCWPVTCCTTKTMDCTKRDR